MSDYSRLYKKAVKRRWVLPVAQDVFGKEAWVRYWTAMVAATKDPDAGRPVPPHRSG